MTTATTGTPQASPTPSNNWEVIMTNAFVTLGMLLLCLQLIVCRVARFCRCSKRLLLILAPPVGDFLANILTSLAIGFLPTDANTVVLIMCLIVLVNKSMPAYGRKTKLLWFFWTAFNFISFAYFHAWSTLRHADLGSKWGWRSVGAYTIVFVMLFASAYCFVFVTLNKADKNYYDEAIDKDMQKTETMMGEQYNYDPSTCHGCWYVVLLEPPKNRAIIRRRPNKESVTVHDIYTYGARQHSNRELCLSFAMFQLLFGLYHGASWLWQQDERNSRKSRDLVVRGLMMTPPPPQQQDHHPANPNDYYLLCARRGFGVVEMELAFLYDHIYGGSYSYILWSPGSGGVWRALSYRPLYYVLKAVMAVMMYIGNAIILLASAGDHRWRVSWWAITTSPLVPYLLFDLLQFVFYCRSDTRMVSCMCHPDAWQQRYFGWFISFIRWFPNCTNSNFSRLDSTVGQYSLLQETTPHNGDALGTGSRRLYTHNAKPSVPAALPPSLKPRIGEVLRGRYCQVPVPQQVEKAQRFLRGTKPQQKITMILKWHIGTSYCEMRSPTNTTSRVVAAMLSKYCAYLVAFRPELLPCPDSTRIFCGVLEEVRRLVGYEQPPGVRLDTLDRRRMESGVHDIEGLAENTDILTHGLWIGHTLTSEIRKPLDLWEILEAIWVNLILRVAPQQPTYDATYAKSHAKCLAEGGEFVTYLWAMLSHAGIENHSPWGPCIQEGRVCTYDPWVDLPEV